MINLKHNLFSNTIELIFDENSYSINKEVFDSIVKSAPTLPFDSSISYRRGQHVFEFTASHIFVKWLSNNKDTEILDYSKIDYHNLNIKEDKVHYNELTSTLVFSPNKSAKVDLKAVALLFKTTGLNGIRIAYEDDYCLDIINRKEDLKFELLNESLAYGEHVIVNKQEFIDANS